MRKETKELLVAIGCLFVLYWADKVIRKNK
jgi:hypothetical protein